MKKVKDMASLSLTCEAKTVREFKFVYDVTMDNRCKETNLLCMNFTNVEYVFVGSTWKRCKNFPNNGANASGVKMWPLPSVRSKYQPYPTA